MANDYCTTTDIQVDIPDSGLASFPDAEFTAALAANITDASREIDDYLGKWPGYFYPTTDGETRYFDGSGEEEQPIDHLVSLTSVAVAESGGVGASDYTTWTENTDFYVWPYNYSALSEPIRRLVIDWNGSKHVWYRYRKAVKVVGIFGWSLTPPAAIKRATEIQALRWYMRAKQGYQDASANVEIGQMQYTKQLDPDVKQLLRRYAMEQV